MPVTALDQKTALIIIDLQKGVADRLPTAIFDPVVERNAALAAAFRDRGLPVVLVTADAVPPGRTDEPSRLGALPPDFTDIVPGLDRQPGDLVINKKSWGVFATTDLEQRLRALAATQVVVTGVATGIGVESTARQAYEAGFNVALAVDAIADYRPGAHDYVLAHVFPRLGETGTAQAIIDLVRPPH